MHTHIARRRRRAGVATALALLLAMSATPDARAQDEEFPSMKLRSAQLLVSTGFASEAHQWWADEIGRRTDGRVTVETFWSGSLVAARDIPAAVAGGAADIGHIPSTYDPARTRLWMTLDLPFNFRDHWCGVSAGRRVAFENEHLAAELENNNMVPLVGYNSGFQQFISKDPLKTVADLEGRRLRSYGGARVPFLEELGITPVFMPFGEIYEAIDRGVLDGSADVVLYLIQAFKLHEIAPNIMMANSGGAIAAPLGVMNREVWEGMPENLQELILEISEEHDMRFARELIEAEERLAKELPEQGVNLNYLSDEERANMQEIAERVQEAWLDESEADGLPARDVWEHFQRLQRECEAEVADKGYPWER